jgi:hypothetical protein
MLCPVSRYGKRKLSGPAYIRKSWPRHPLDLPFAHGRASGKAHETSAPPQRGARAIAEPKLNRRDALTLDRGVKLADCRRIISVEQILLVASEDRHVEVWRRAEDGWMVQDLIGDATLPLAIDGQPLPLAAVYDGVAL